MHQYVISLPEDKIPRVIHYCWFSGEAIPTFIQSCISTWKKVMPDYELRVWDKNSFDFESVPFVKEAFYLKKWAFVADYIRFFALYTEGGIYLDSDVKVLKRFDSFLKYDFFTSHEIHPANFDEVEQKKLNKDYVPVHSEEFILGLNIQAAIMGSSKGNLLMKDCLDFYQDKHYQDTEGKALSEQFMIGPVISKHAEKYGYRYHQQRQQLINNMIIYEPDVFVGNMQYLDKNSYAIHLCNGSWKEKSKFENFFYQIRNKYPNFYRFFSPIEKVAMKVNFMLSKN